jgi:DMSO/TMAO reductase YedYZ molybdopterin-dependent catalytic subunit
MLAGAAWWGAAAVAASTSPRSNPPRMDRRAFMGRAVALVSGLSLAGGFAIMGSQVLSAARSRSGGRLLSFPPDSFGPTPALTPVSDFYVVAKNLISPSVSADSWRLAVDGLVDHPTAYSIAMLRALPAQSAYRTLECISTEIVQGDHLISNQLWTGVRVSDLLDRAGVQAGASWILWEAADGYTESIPVDVARNPDTWIAYEMNGRPLPPEHGFPARVLIPGRFGMKQPKWVTRLRVSAHDAAGYWEQRDWDEQAVVRTMSRIDFPEPRTTVPAGQPFNAYGIANAGDRGIAQVQISADGGTSWVDARLQDAAVAPLGPLTWVLWRASITVAQPGSAHLVVRAVDGKGHLQSGNQTPALPSGSTGWHAVPVTAV